MGLGFTEGPIVLDGNTLAVASVNRGTVYRLGLDGGDPELLIDCGGGPNGLALGTGGEIHIAQNGATAMPSRSSVPAVPSIQTLAGDRLMSPSDHRVDAPSDCVTGPDGLLWFTDPADHVMEGPGKPGRVRTWDPVSSRIETRLHGLMFPNGIAFGADPAELYVAETSARVVRRYQATATGATADGWCAEIPRGHPDGIAVDAEGWLWVAGSRGNNIMAFDRSGRLREDIDLGEGMFATSLCFAGPGLEHLVVTSPKRGSVLLLRPPHPGLPLPVWRPHLPGRAVPGQRQQPTGDRS
ncbi:SMP-30/gluconolactonase/LRE family protein [Streptomyces rhizosphaericus]|uniref:SMP-30/gluconolactonase/LRE family protein n=1 Tax=Streptomyces rhizosphaericus TaxID=114699 RepID=A0A6G4AHZ2_9ACTN|nr:SMP-30/gluconolactonase/LRE family protein [Streptomyces rhizosphaericus]NEW72945.1 SMP-30/gluconolactonase/LRE family protein [Streptomyces rhizosphaericus]